MGRIIGVAVLLIGMVVVALATVRMANRMPAAKSVPTVRSPQVAEDEWSASDEKGRRERNLPASERAALVETFCTTCHMLPAPDCEPRNLWPGKISEMYNYARTERPVAEANTPDISLPIEYWTNRAPEYLPVPQDAMDSPPSPLPFERHMIELEGIGDAPSVSSIQFVHLTDDAIQLLVCDMRYGRVVLWTPADSTATVLAEIRHPSHATIVDLDGDGQLDILVANLGDYWPVDTDQGSVLWLRNQGNAQFEKFVLMDGLNRVNEVQAADFDGDGDQDLVVGVFGNLATGMTVYMENFTQDYADPQFESFPLDYRTGTSDLPIVDLDEDGHLDFIALRSQENEHIYAYMNRGQGTFREELIYQAPHPRWGSTGIRLSDLDRDGDVDVLFNHGDSVQLPPIPRPYHGFAWLENCGEFPFVYHRLAHMPGAHTSLPADLDGDGDLDLVSCAFIPTLNPEWPNTEMLDSVVWLEQLSPGEYRRYRLESGTPYHACADLGDWDGDGDVDVVLGNFNMLPEKKYVPWTACITVLENQLISGKEEATQ